MPNRFRSHLRHNVVAYLALFMALGGTAVAAKPLITGEDIRDDTVTGADVQNDSLTGADVLESSLAEVPGAAFANFAIGARNAGGVNRQTRSPNTPLQPLFETDVNGVQISAACTVAGPQLELSPAPGREPPDVMYGFTLDTPGDPESGFFNQFEAGDGLGDGISVVGLKPVVSLVVGSGFDFARVDIAGFRGPISGCEFLRWIVRSKDPE